MPSLLTKNGKLVIKNGRLVTTNDPALCPCCGSFGCPCDTITQFLNVRLRWCATPVPPAPPVEVCTNYDFPLLLEKQAGTPPGTQPPCTGDFGCWWKGTVTGHCSTPDTFDVEFAICLIPFGTIVDTQYVRVNGGTWKEVENNCPNCWMETELADDISDGGDCAFPGSGTASARIIICQDGVDYPP